MVYLKLQPFRYNAFGLHQSLKHTTKFYGPFKILEMIGQSAYKLHLPEIAEMHPIFHVSQLKKHIGSKAVPQANLPLVTSNGYIKLEPIEVLDTRTISRADDIITQWQIQWQNLIEAQSTWEDKLFIKSTFPEFHFRTLKSWWPDGVPCGQENSEGELYIIAQLIADAGSRDRVVAGT
jgi:hypothetical protein